MKNGSTTTDTINRLLDIDMEYKAGSNNYQTGNNRREQTIKIAGRFKMVAPVLIKNMYNISHRLALEHLNKLVQEGYLALYKTPRAVDGRIYILTYTGSRYATELLGVEIPFRHSNEPSSLVNHNSIAHDLMNAYVLCMGCQTSNYIGGINKLWNGFVTEFEFKRIYPTNDIRNVDGLIRECNQTRSVSAVEIEASHKNLTQRQTILLKFLSGLNAGIYEKVFMFSQSERIFNDIRRFHKQMYEDLISIHNKKTKRPYLTQPDVELLKQSIVCRTKFCDELQLMFYP